MKQRNRINATGLFLAILLLGYGWNPLLHAAPKAPEAGGVQVHVQSAQPVSVNKAGAEELERIKGIGPELASRIVAYRDEHGAFKSVDELQSVRGIGAVKLEKIKSEITL